MNYWYFWTHSVILKWVYLKVKKPIAATHNSVTLTHSKIPFYSKCPAFINAHALSIFSFCSSGVDLHKYAFEVEKLRSTYVWVLN